MNPTAFTFNPSATAFTFKPSSTEFVPSFAAAPAKTEFSLAELDAALAALKNKSASAPAPAQAAPAKPSWASKLLTADAPAVVAKAPVVAAPAPVVQEQKKVAAAAPAPQPEKSVNVYASAIAPPVSWSTSKPTTATTSTARPSAAVSGGWGSSSSSSSSKDKKSHHSGSSAAGSNHHKRDSHSGPKRGGDSAAKGSRKPDGEKRSPKLVATPFPEPTHDGPIIKYDKSFLLKFQLHYTTRPSELELDEDIDIEVPESVILEKVRREIEEMKANAERKRNHRNREDAPLRDKYGKIIEIKPLEHHANRWVPMQKLAEGDELVYKAARGILNKLTPEKFSKLLSQLLELKINSANLARGIFTVLFEKACMEHGFSAMYADFSVALISKLGSLEAEETVSFRELVISHVIYEFKQPSATVPESVTDAAERSEKELKIRTREFGIIKFIGELFNKEVLTVEEFVPLLDELEDELESNGGEGLCRLLETCGATLEKELPERVSKTMEAIADAAKVDGISSRTKFMLLDLVERFQHGWTARRAATVAPKKLDHAALAAAAEKSEKDRKAKQDEKDAVEKRRRAATKQTMPKKVVASGEWVERGGRAPRTKAPAPAAEVVVSKKVVSRFGILEDDSATSSDDEFHTAQDSGSETASSDGRESYDTPLSTAQTLRADSQDVSDDDVDGGAHDGEISRKARSTTEELFFSKDLTEASICILEIAALNHHNAHLVIVEIISAAIEETAPEKRALCAEFFLELQKLKDGHLFTPAVFARGFGEVLSLLPDMVLDIPKAGENLLELTRASTASGMVKLSEIFSATKSLGSEPDENFVALATAC